ncbi:hypothetical protein DEMA109039_22675 [Deinococcus marmoris]
MIAKYAPGTVLVRLMSLTPTNHGMTSISVGIIRVDRIRMKMMFLPGKSNLARV